MPCRVVHVAASRQALEVRLAVQHFLNDVKEGVATGDASYVLGDHMIIFEEEGRRVRCDTCQRYHPLLKLSAFLSRKCK